VGKASHPDSTASCRILNIVDDVARNPRRQLPRLNLGRQVGRSLMFNSAFVGAG